MSKSSLRLKANAAKLKRCTTLIAVLENPKTIENVGSTIRNVDALGVGKLYIIDGHKILGNNPDWLEFRNREKLNKISVSAVKYTYVKVFNDTQSCIDHLKKERYTSMVTSPHVKGKTNVILEEGNYTDKRLAIWFGNESRGVSEEAIDSSVSCINIPMCGIIESLNLGTSTGIVLYEVARQRRTFKIKKQKKLNYLNPKITEAILY